MLKGHLNTVFRREIGTLVCKYHHWRQFSLQRSLQLYCSDQAGECHQYRHLSRVSAGRQFRFANCLLIRGFYEVTLHAGTSGGQHEVSLLTSAVKRSIGSITGCTITEKAPTRAFSWLKAPTSAFTFKTLLRHYAKQALTPRSLNVKFGPRHKSQKLRAGWLA